MESEFSDASGPIRATGLNRDASQQHRPQESRHLLDMEVGRFSMKTRGQHEESVHNIETVEHVGSSMNRMTRKFRAHLLSRNHPQSSRAQPDLACRPASIESLYDASIDVAASRDREAGWQSAWLCLSRRATRLPIFSSPSTAGYLVQPGVIA